MEYPDIKLILPRGWSIRRCRLVSPSDTRPTRSPFFESEGGGSPEQGQAGEVVCGLLGPPSGLLCGLSFDQIAVLSKRDPSLNQPVPLLQASVRAGWLQRRDVMGEFSVVLGCLSLL
ncbi:hypothetical protein TEQG_04672 [Trichophyton equinum CBS 127.97]|uniref:Uncharacterized protein n=1 Tax=Trichophyton equinum (strain ATCC MYA-4606 / CBS 127.97) TaxID=559882 RepID=F2PUU5_TRIEC|nr:hypothetical protein TEQG_04672 [Trichophyton equinum CBS 127.97]